MAKTRTKRRQTRTKRRQPRIKRRQTRTINKQDNVGGGVTQSKGSIPIQKEINDVSEEIINVLKEIINELTKILIFEYYNTKKYKFINLIKKCYRNIYRKKNTTERTNIRIEKTISRNTRKYEKWDKEVIPLKEKNFINKNKAIIYYKFLQIINDDITILNEYGSILTNTDIHRNINGYFKDKQININGYFKDKQINNYIKTLIDKIQNLIDKIEYEIV